ncbi:MAG: gephyrin-like molybdotransferase Glp [Dehalococcoidales bacterium]
MKWADNLISTDKALTLILEQLNPVERTEMVQILEASNRVLAEDIIATHNVPPFNRAAMDGYALNSADTKSASQQNTVKLIISGEIYAGDISSHHVQPRSCMYIATGAVIPAGTDAVIRIENTSISDGCISINSPVRSFENVAPAGEDIRSGKVVLNSGTLLSPARAGVLASQGIEQVKVYSKPVVPVITTGDELAQPPEALRPGQIYDVNNTTLRSLICLSGGFPVKLTGLGDSLKSLEQGFEQALNGDMIVVSGGSSVGQKDYMSELLASMGQIIFHGLNAKPGKPTLFAVVKGKPVLALPGYPTSCLINAYILLKPAIRKLARLPGNDNRTIEAFLAGRISASKRRQFVTVELDGTRARPTGKESGAITATAYASGYITVPENTEVSEGAPVKVTLF